jgi:hypothetical protein
VSNLPAVSTIGKFTASVARTGGKFATVVVDTNGAPDLQISPQIFDKNLNDPNVIFRNFGKMIYEKNMKQIISWHCPFKNLFIESNIFSQTKVNL